MGVFLKQAADRRSVQTAIIARLAAEFAVLEPHPEKGFTMHGQLLKSTFAVFA
jgi:hypothetical protein